MIYGSALLFKLVFNLSSLWFCNYERCRKGCLIGIFWCIYWWKSFLVTYHTKVLVWTGKLCILLLLIFWLYSFMGLNYNSEGHWLQGDLVLGVEIVFPSQIFILMASWNLVDFYMTNMLLFATILVRCFINKKKVERGGGLQHVFNPCSSLGLDWESIYKNRNLLNIYLYFSILL